jgi:hypothetical protein
MHSGHQQQFTINVWAGLIGDVLVGPHVLPRRLTGPQLFGKRLGPTA